MFKSQIYNKYVVQQISCDGDIYGVSNQSDKILKKFGTHVREMRIHSGLTQVEVSSRMNRDQQSLQRVEAGRVNPSLLYMIELAEALEVNLMDLVNFTDRN